MQTHILNCGYLNVGAGQMIKPLSIDQINANYRLDRNGNIRLSMNALLVVEGQHLVLMDPGCADFLPSRLRKDYGLEISVTIEEQLEGAGYTADQVTDVIFTHLHFDHGSGAFKRIPGKIIKRFPNAKYRVMKEHFKYASTPDQFKANSFFTSFFKYVDALYWLEDWEHEWIEFRVFNGHTRGMAVPVIKTPEIDTCYLTDLIPMELFLEPGVHSGYDLDPVLANNEKMEFLSGLDKSSQLIYFHDPLKDSMFYP